MSGSTRFSRHRVDLDLLEAGALSSVETGEHLVEFVAPGDVVKSLPVEGIEMDIEAPQSCTEERFRLRLQQDSVGREAEIFHAFNARQLFDEHRQIFPDQWLAPGHPDLRTPRETAMRANRSISSKRRISRCST